nr:MAG TPA: hypothetical protein [Caudoviricetes sp.]
MGSAGISQRVISAWWTFGRLRAIAGLKNPSGSDGYHRHAPLAHTDRSRTNQITRRSCHAISSHHTER